MPEMITKHPAAMINVLEHAGARCAEGLPQEILKDCPAERFCKLPRGETCVWGFADISRMSPSQTEGLAAAVCPAWGVSAPEALAIGAALVVGLAVGRWGRR